MLYFGIEATQQQMVFGLVLIVAIALTIDRSKLKTVK
jgi:ribose transport system permease protein